MGTSGDWARKATGFAAAIDRGMIHGMSGWLAFSSVVSCGVLKDVASIKMLL
jgi:hypothetical protein